MEKVLMVKNISKWIKGMGIEPDTIDIENFVDGELSLKENKENFKKEFHLSQMTESDKVRQHEVDNALTEKLQEEEEKEIKEIAENQGGDIDRYFDIPIKLVKLVAQGFHNSLFLIGDGGMGKTTIVKTTLNKLNMSLGKDYIYLKTYSTARGLFDILAQYPDKLVILDDVEGLLKSPVNISVLKSATETEKVRTLSWIIKGKENLTHYTGRIIILLNTYPKSHEIKALMSRSLHFNMEFDRKTILRIIKGIAKKPKYDDIKVEEQLKIVKWIGDNITPSVENLNLRTYLHILSIYRWAKKNNMQWATMGGIVMQDSKDLKYIMNLQKAYMQDKDRVKDFIENGYGSRAKYYRLKTRLVL